MVSRCRSITISRRMMHRSMMDRGISRGWMNICWSGMDIGWFNRGVCWRMTIGWELGCKGCASQCEYCKDLSKEIA